MFSGKQSCESVSYCALEIMQEVASDLNKSKRQSIFDIAIADWDHRDCLAGDDLQRNIFGWLSPPDPWKNYHIACESHHGGSAAWFIEGNTFSEWKASEAQSSLLWVHGKRPSIPRSYSFSETDEFPSHSGCGKKRFLVRQTLILPSRVLIVLNSSTIIKDIDAMRKAGLASLAFFYFDFREDQKKDLRGLLSSLLDQLCHQSDSYCDMISKFYSEHVNGRRRPSDDALAGCLKDLLGLPGLAPVYLIVDALDECPNTSAYPSPRSKVLSLIEELILSQFPNLRICVTSRPEMDIKDILDPLVPCCVSLHDESGQKEDIEDYIKSVISTHPKNRRWKAEHKQLVIDVLTEKADGR
jgi:NACHT domain